MTEHKDLAERIERADGPDRALDAEIALATRRFFLAEPRYPGAERMYGYIDADGTRVEPGNGGQHSLIPAYTASIDAAMQLVPEGWGGSIHFSEDRPDCELHCTVSLGRSYPTNANVYAGRSGKDGDRAALALAICAAALRAQVQP